MRVFIAIELNSEVKEKLRAVQSQLARYTEKGRFTKSGNFHLTLRFIGEVEEEKQEKIKRVMNETAARTEVFSLNLDQLGSFKRKGREIIWVGLSGQLDVLEKLYKNLEEQLEARAGIEKEARAYTPHITLGRQVKLQKDLQDLGITVPEAAIEVKKLSLMESTREGGELVYRPLYMKKFQK